MPSTVMFASPSLTAVTETSPTLSNNMDYTTDGESYSLFDSTPDLFPNEAYGTPLSPPNDADDKFSYAESPYPITSPSESKKTAPPPKKRKTWGQQLPEPKTCLAPRKRAKTVDEKEQRRVERVLRNRKAAQISRERKRLEVEQLEREKSQVERRNQELELRVRAIEARNQQLEAQIAQLTGSPPSPAGTTITDVERLQQQPSRIPTTFTDNLFASSDNPSDSRQPSPFSLDTIRSQNQYLPTIDPTSLSPKAPLLRDSSNASSNDMTQHPAVSVIGTTALDELHSNGFLVTPSPHVNIDQFVGLSSATFDNSQLHFQPLLNNFEPNNNLNNHLDFHESSVLELFEFDDYINGNETVDSPFSQQPPFGASPVGCDVGSVAV